MFFLHRIKSEKQIYRFAHYGKCVHIFHLFSRTFRFWAKSKMIWCCHDFFFLHSAYVTNNFLCGEIVKTLFFTIASFFHLIKKASSSASFERTSFSSPLKMFCSDLLIKFQQLQSHHLTIYPLLNSICAFCYLFQSMRKKNKYTLFFKNS